jgi:hypothetical protein
MRPSNIPLIPLLLIVMILMSACGGPPKEKTVYWRGEMWDGMNRLVFALQDLGWHVDTVDTDSGRILACRARDGGDEKAADDFYRILVQFSENPDIPVTIGPEEPGDEAYQTTGFLRKISEITKRFEWYGGTSVEVIG